MTGPQLDRVLHLTPLPRARRRGAQPGPGSSGSSHADFRFERIRYQELGVRDGALQGASDSEDLGFAVRVIHRGAWGFASAVVLTPEEAALTAERAVEVALVAGRMTSAPVEIAPEPVVRRRDLGLVVRREPARRADRRQGRAAHRLDQPAAHRCRRRPRVGVPAPGAGEQVLRRPRRHPHHPAAGPAAARVRGDGRPGPTTSTRWRPSRRRWAAAGSTSPTAAGTGTTRSTRCPSCSPRSSRHPASRPAPTTWSSTRPTCG